MKRLLGIVLAILLVAGLIWTYALRDTGTAPADRGATVGTVSFACAEGRSITATFYAGGQQAAPAPGEPPVPTGSVDLVLSDARTVTLPQTLSADGGRYANADESFLFWAKGNGAFIMENGTTSYSGCIRMAADPGGLPEEYANATEGFSVRLPSVSTASSSATAFTIDDSYRYEALGPGKSIAGVRFTIPRGMAEGTNLSQDTYVSVETIPDVSDCDARRFLDATASSSIMRDAGSEYSFASTTDAAAGNRYEESVFALPGTSPCMAVRYFIHYGAIENYPDGAVREFDRASLLSVFDAIRRTLVIGQ